MLLSRWVGSVKSVIGPINMKGFAVNLRCLLPYASKKHRLNILTVCCSVFAKVTPQLSKFCPLPVSPHGFVVSHQTGRRTDCMYRVTWLSCVILL